MPLLSDLDKIEQNKIYMTFCATAQGVKVSIPAVQPLIEPSNVAMAANYSEYLVFGDWYPKFNLDVLSESRKRENSLHGFQF